MNTSMGDSIILLPCVENMTTMVNNSATRVTGPSFGMKIRIEPCFTLQGNERVRG